MPSAESHVRRLIDQVIQRIEKTRLRPISSLRENLIRISPNIYNTPDEIDRFLAAAAG